MTRSRARPAPGWHRLALLPVWACLEVLAVLAASRGSGPAAALLLHLGASACVAGWLRTRLLDAGGGWALALPFVQAAFVPVLGGLGLAIVAAAMPRGATRRDPAAEFTRTPIPGALEPVCARPSGAAGCGPPPSPRDSRVATLAATRHRRDTDSVALLWRALRDPEEEVRLLAFSLLESKTAAAYHRIQAHAAELESATGLRRGVLHARLAFEHWELAWLGLVQGEILNHELGKAEEHARAALEHDRRSVAMHFLLARIYLKSNRPGEARAMLTRAGELGLPAPMREPYLAEAAFRLRRFDLVRIHLAQAGLAAGNDATSRVQRFWQ